ncbi:helix-turn-helix domain-containing protein [Streptomyces gelaticus]|uniref:helix-turn-helix domain-containing protein n=1 Tax=unclassified Streptomyces TaxID=2593676 RepID=UPI0011E70CB7|nr:helix-turn-helix transcriptional regulator [Streptomyces sp. sk2.1]TXS80567.1 XRE family transcriptional regulator [Streptomyces sp. sk2.1]
MVRRLSYHWHLRRIMAAHNIWKTTELIPLLRDRGINLSTAQVYRLVTDQPERLSLPVLAALCDILDCSPGDLIEPYVEADRRKRTADEATVIDLKTDLRPERARILED